MKTGIYKISNDEYHESAGVSRSSLMEFSRSPYAYWYKYLSGDYVKPNETESLIIGNMVHVSILEPDMLDALYYPMPKINRSLKAGKELYAEHVERAENRIIVDAEAMKAAIKMRSLLLSDPSITRMLSGASIESSFYFDYDGVLCKSRPDALKNGLVVDLKTTECAQSDAFTRSAVKYGYYLQAGMCAEALKANDIDMNGFVFVAVEKKPPYLYCIYVMDDEAIDYGREQFNALITQYKDCLQRNEWPGLGVKTLKKPKWSNLNDDGE